MHVNSVHALLALLRQHSRASQVDGAKVNVAKEIEQLLASAKGAQFRLELLEKMVADQFAGSVVLPNSGHQADIGKQSGKIIGGQRLSSHSTDAINRSPHQTHGRTWDARAAIWNSGDSEYLKVVEIKDSAMVNSEPTIAAHRFTPTLEDIQSALFRDDLEPEEFAKAFLTKAQFDERPKIYPDHSLLVVIVFAVICFVFAVLATI